MSVSVIVGVFGDPSWIERAKVAVASAEDQSLRAEDAIISYGNTLAEARNGGAERTTGDWLCFLDADDELDHGYIEAMTEAIDKLSDNLVLLQPATLGVVDGVEDDESVVIPRKNILDGNFMVIGTLIHRDVFMSVGGFTEWPMYEDWDLWIRSMKRGCESYPVPDAIYRVGVSTESRNNQSRALQVKTFNAIRSQYV